MNEEQINSVPKVLPDSLEQKTQDTESVLGLSFIPPELEGKRGACEKCAIASVVFGGISLVSWVIMLFGIVISLTGVVLGIIGLKSPQKRHAKIGLILSVIGFIAVFIYAFAAASGMIHYSYFTTQLL